MEPIEPKEQMESNELMKLMKQMDPKVAFNSSTQEWSRNILELNKRDIYKYIDMYRLTNDEIKLIKKQRRKMLNCFYARISRGKKKINTF